MLQKYRSSSEVRQYFRAVLGIPQNKIQTSNSKIIVKTCYQHFPLMQSLATTTLPAYELPLEHSALSLARGTHRSDLGRQLQARPWPESWPSLPQ